jgi:hypothetical protein
MAASNPAVSFLDRFERAFVLSTSRALFLGIAVIAACALFGGGAVFAYTMTPTIRGAEPPMPSPPSPPEVSLSDVLAILDAPKEVYDGIAEGDFVEAALVGGAPGSEQEDQRFSELAIKLGSFFDQSRYPWLSETQTVCSYRSYYGCYSWENKTVRKGIVEMLNEVLKSRALEEQLVLLQAMVELMPLCIDEDTRFIAIGTVVDLVNAAGKMNDEHLAAVKAILTPPANADGTPGAVLSASLAQDYMKGILKARKRGAHPRLLSVWMSAIPELYTLFGNDINGQSNRIEGMVASWLALQGTLPELVEARLEGIKTIARAAPEPRRPEIIRAYGDIVRNQAAEAQRQYQNALKQRELTLAQLDADVKARDAEKTSLRAGASSIVGIAFMLIAGVGLLLALLAVERNTRALKDVLVRLEPPKP